VFLLFFPASFFDETPLSVSFPVTLRSCTSFSSSSRACPAHLTRDTIPSVGHLPRRGAPTPHETRIHPPPPFCELQSLYLASMSARSRADQAPRRPRVWLKENAPFPVLSLRRRGSLLVAPRYCFFPFSFHSSLPGRPCPALSFRRPDTVRSRNTYSRTRLPAGRGPGSCSGLTSLAGLFTHSFRVSVPPVRQLPPF